jgi:acyl-CoA synthetase (NDP forming)
VLGIADERALRDAYARMAAQFGPSCLLQPQIESGIEILLGMVNDAQFGPMVTVGLGGIFAEIFGDVVTIRPPITQDDALRHLARLKAYKVLQGARGRPDVDLEALARAIQSFSTLCIAVGPWLSEMDINPLIATRSGLLAVDALAIPMRDKGETPA